ncbi:MAG TPA: O-antigen ligase family protein [Thermomicrobiales bacterium]|nr:O-antigen ligase family protein [Thermomicrobiales bacterium]
MNDTIAGRPSRGIWAASGRAAEFSFRRLLLPILAATALLSFVFAESGNLTAAWLTAFIFATFILAMYGPAWVLAPILINEMTLYGFTNPTFGIAQRFVIAAIALAIALPAIFRARLSGDRYARRVVLPAIGFLAIVTLMNIQHSDDGYVYQYLRYQLVQFAILVIAACVLYTIPDMKRIALVVAVVTTGVALIVIWQHYAPATALYGPRDDTVKGRAVGLTKGPVPIATQLIFVLAPMLGVLIAKPLRLRRGYLLLAGSTVLTLAALNFTYTRSALFALAPALVVMGLLFGGQRRTLMISAVIVVIVLFFGLENSGVFGSRYYEGSDEDRSAASHQALQDVSLAIALDHPLDGIGHEAFTDVSLDYIDDIAVQISADGGASALGQQEPHNDYWNIWLSWGIVALALYIALIVATFRNLRIAARHRDRFVRGLAIGCIGGLVAYCVNSAYHNSLDSSMSLWLYAGISIALARLARADAASMRRQRQQTGLGAP